MPRKPQPARLADRPDDFERLGIDRVAIAVWEDGLRTDGGPGSYEWWYFDATLDDGSTLVIAFFTKQMIDVGKPLAPHVTIQCDRPDDSHIDITTPVYADAFSAATDRCDVRVGPNTFRGDLHEYVIHAEGEGVVVDVTLTGQVRPWRPATGHLLFGPRGDEMFAWLPSVPQGRVTATITVAGSTETLAGIGYHDHNWGNVSMLTLMNHWYWARARIGDYTVIASYITAETAYGGIGIPVFLLARGDEVLADDPARVNFTVTDVHVDEETGKPVADTVIYDYDDSSRYRITFHRRETILRHHFVDDLSEFKHMLAKLMGFDGAYLRFTGDLELQRFADDISVEHLHHEAVWELMYFGHVRADPNAR